MKENSTTLHIQKQAVIIKARLEKIKSFLSDGNKYTINKIRKSCGGSGVLYSTIKDLGLIHKDRTTGYWAWNNSIPITLLLGVTVATAVLDKSRENKEKYTTKKTGGDSKANLTKISLTKETPMLVQQEEAAFKVNYVPPANEAITPKNRKFSFSILWGLIKFGKS